jgi:hypothetical protein
VYGTVAVVPASTPSTYNSTLVTPILSAAVAVTVIASVSVVVLPDSGLVIDIVGEVVSGVAGGGVVVC